MGVTKLANQIIELGRYLKKLEKKGVPIEYSLEMTNTGITKDLLNESPFIKYINLGGKDITINIKIPNKIKYHD